MGSNIDSGCVGRRSIHLLISSMSAGGRSVGAGRRVVSILRAGDWHVRVSVTSASDDPVAIAASTNEDVTAALGGDGYIAATARGCFESGLVFAPIPGGRGNDLCRALGIGTDPIERARALAGLGLIEENDGFVERIRGLDGIWVNSADGKRLVLGVISLGVDAKANLIANESSLNNGPLAYGYGAVAAFTTHQHQPIRALVDGEETDLGGWLASISNSGRFGGGITLVPESDLHDGVIELMHAGPVSAMKALPILARALAGRAARGDVLSCRTIHTIEVLEPAGMIAMADGDRVARIPFTAEVAPHVVDVLI
ncbi:diacylglycerol/lipid kinase family protein [Schaalia vaccimaxillae]|uniref:diacylglycerol/lipid kinase family protein n=1 Tax=Schaalia vaccimaxillae TaxID=183916 RepID=UPI0003B62EEF|nr:diacylglycerol kinase family protein [Schaalia vaccimaxillae]